MNSHETVGKPDYKSQVLKKLLMETNRNQALDMVCQLPDIEHKIPYNYKKWIIDFTEKPSNICYDFFKKAAIKCYGCQKPIKEEAIKCRDYNLKHYLLQKPPIPAYQKNQAEKNGNVVNIFHYDKLKIQELIENTDNQLMSLGQDKEMDDVLRQTKVDEVLQQFSKILGNMEKKKFFYLMEPYHYFEIYDLPQLKYLSCRRKHLHKGMDNLVKDISEINLPEWCASVLKMCDSKREQLQKDNTFQIEVTTEKVTEQKRMEIFRAPQICQDGRLEAYGRFIVKRGRAEMVHSFIYQNRATAEGQLSKHSEDPFCDEDAWYYEMCSGVSLVAELASCIKTIEEENEHRAGVSTSNLDGSERWKNCFEPCILEALKRFRHFIIRCPAVYWRIVCLRKVICDLNKFCIGLEDIQTISRQLPSIYDIVIPHSLRPASKEQWIERGVDIFGALISSEYNKIQVNQLDYPNISSAGTMCGIEMPLWEPYSSYCYSIDPIGHILGETIRNPSLIFPDNSWGNVFWPAAYMDLRIGDYGLHVIASHAEVKPFSVSGVNCSDAPYLRFCLTHQDPGIKDLIEEARVLSKAKINVKLREKAGIFKIFNDVHRSLYCDDKGFFDMPI